jgi:glycosidase
MIRTAILTAMAVTVAGCTAPARQSEASASLPQAAQAQAAPERSVPDYTPRDLVVEHPEWARNAAIYQINTRQFTPEGTFEAARAELPRLAEMGIDIVWLMPIHPIGEAERKGSLGSPYAVRDFYGVNPEFGTLEDLRAFIADAHALDMHVILDWVANHSAWDNPLVTEHPDWYTRDANGEMQFPPGTDWSDVVDFNYDSPELRQYMTEVMAWWVQDVGVDGFRADVAGMVPIDFWQTLRSQLDEIKPTFMLAEWETRDHHDGAFSATYAWSWNNTMHDIAMGDADVGGLRGYYFYDQDNTWPADAYRLTYTANHDQNAWVATQFDRWGEALEAVFVLSVVGEGMPMVYNGQEAGNPKMLEFFERDPIEWRDHPLNDHFTRLFGLLEVNSAIWHGEAGGQMVDISNSNPDDVFSFVRANGDDAVFAVFNFSAEAQSVNFEGDVHGGGWSDFSTGETASFDADTTLDIEPWGWRVYVRGAR